jgi:DNA-binding response OmpR family regulator
MVAECKKFLSIPALRPSVNLLHTYRPADMITPTQQPVARVLVITRSELTSLHVTTLLADDTTSVVRCDDLSCLQTEERPDVLVLDRDLLAEADGTMRRIRRRWPTVIVVVMNATGEADVGRLLDAGADDAVGASSPLLASRLHALTRRARTLNAGARIAVGDILFDRESRRVWCAGREVELTRTEEAFLDCLFWHTPRAVGVTTLTDFVWGAEVTPDRRSMVRVYMGYLRTKLKASRHVVIRTVRGVGYAFTPR